jgi:arylsulfatase
MDRPNIVFVFPDQWRFDCLGVAGHTCVETPFLDELAHSGVRFTNCYSPSPTCIATRASLMTGLSPNSAGRMGYRDGVPWTYANTFPRLLRDSGYQTMCAGKTHFYPARARCGFEELRLYEMPWQEPDRPSDYHRWLAKETGGSVSDTAWGLDSNSWVAHPWTEPERLHPSSWTTDAAIELMEQRDPLRPFFIQVSYHRPHPPLDPPIEYFERYLAKQLPPTPVGDWAEDNNVPVTSVDHSVGRIPDEALDRARRAYFAQISHLDYQVGRLRRYLKGRGLLGNTWIVFASDHGELLGDHHLWRKTNGFEGSAHVPLIVSPPLVQDRPAPALCDCPCTLTDLAATFLELGGATSPEPLESDSLLPLVRGQDAAWKDFVHGEHAPGWQFLTDGREKFIWFAPDDRRWLFDLAEDPNELHNLAEDPAWASHLALWEGRLIEILKDRPEGLSDGERLVPGHLPAIRDWLLE